MDAYIGEEYREVDDTLWRAPVTDQVAAPATAAPELLPFHARSWEDFERAILIIAEQVDGLRGVRLYGTRGQDQKGIDLYGADDDGRNVAYQPKRVVDFDENALTAAVEKFDVAERAVSAEKLVICVACATDRTQMSEALERLRSTHADIDIDLYDGRRLSELLKTRPDIVNRLFGEAWAAAFCRGASWPVPELAPSDVLADGLVRGPLVALGLAESMSRCEDLADTDPAAAAEVAGDIIDQLVAADFGAFAYRLRAQRAELLVQAGEVEEAMSLLAELVWEAVEAGATSSDAGLTGRIRALSEEHDLPSGRAFVEFIGAVDDWYGQPHRSLELLAERLQQMTDLDHPLVDVATLFVLEVAIAVRDTETARDLAQEVDGLVAATAAAGHDLVSVRLRAAKADVDREWTPLLRDSRSGRLGGALGSLVAARYGRASTRDERSEDAEAEYERAIQQACSAGLNAEAALLVRSLIELRVRFGAFGGEMGALSELASSLAATGGRLLPSGLYGALDSGSAALANVKLPAALRSFRTALRSAVIRGDLNQEGIAHKGLVDVLVRAGERSAALKHAVAAGEAKAVEMCTPIEAYVDISPALSGGPHWERSVAWAAVAAEADLVPDDAVEGIIDSALIASQEARRSLLGPYVDLNAWKAVAAFAGRLSTTQAESALDLLGPSIERESNHYRYEDEEHVAIVAAIIESHPTLRDRAAHHLAHVVEQGDRFADQACDAIARLADRPQLLMDLLSALADDDHASAIEVLAVCGIAHPKTVPAARAALEALLTTDEPAAGTMHFGLGVGRTAYRSRILEEDARLKMALFCADLAEAVDRPESNRTEGADGLVALADTLTDGDRSALFGRMMALVTAKLEPSIADQSLMGGLHPLSTMRVDLDWGSLRRTALRAAAALAASEDQSSEVVAAALVCLVSRSDRDVQAAAKAISLLDRDYVSVDLILLADHPIAMVRQLAVLLAVHKWPTPVELILRLAADRDVSVRRTLATSLSDLSVRDSEVALRVRDSFSTDAHWSVRHLVERSHTA
jgi:hypothetical protein